MTEQGFELEPLSQYATILPMIQETELPLVMVTIHCTSKLKTFRKDHVLEGNQRSLSTGE